MNRKSKTASLLIAFLVVLIPTYLRSQEKEIKKGMRQKPNVILIMTDDQGYGDIGAKGIGAGK